MDVAAGTVRAKGSWQSEGDWSHAREDSKERKTKESHREEIIWRYEREILVKRGIETEKIGKRRDRCCKEAGLERIRAGGVRIHSWL